jgi:glutathione reductase (NADPH)
MEKFAALGIDVRLKTQVTRVERRGQAFAVYAAGDAARKGPPLTPVSSRDARAVATNILQGNTVRPDYRAVPTVAFTSPPLAAVGLTEEEARKRGLRFRTRSERVDSWFTAR